MLNNQEVIDKYFNLSSEQAISQEHPKATILIGEHGTGKEVLTTETQEEYQKNGGSILVDHDLLSFADPHIADHAVDHLITEATSNKYNLVISKDFDNQSLDTMTENLKQKGYSVDVRAMANPKSLIEHRQTEQTLYNTAILGIHHVEHDFDEHSVSNQLQHLELDNKVDQIQIYDRVGNEVYQNQKDGQNVWLKNEHAYNVYNFERNKPLQQSEQQYINIAQHQVNELKNSISSLNNQNIKEKSLESELNKQIELTLDKPKFIRDANNYKGVQNGIVIDENEKFMILKVNNMVGIRYDKHILKDDTKGQENTFRIGQELYVNHSGQDQNVMNEQEIQQHQAEEIQQHLDNQVNVSHER